MDNISALSLTSFVEQRNGARQLFTAGPASLVVENLTGLRPCFGRNDDDYLAAENIVLGALRKMSGHSHLIRLQGSASLAIEIAVKNFLTGRVLVIDTGFYSERLKSMAQSAISFPGAINTVQNLDWTQIHNASGTFDWVLACSSETSTGLKLPITELRQLADKLGAQLMLDATASIGLEDRHELADVIAYSSCKGLFGLTGASFVASHELPTCEVDSFYLNYTNHQEKRMTGPYHTILSLVDLLPRHADFREAVVINKRIFSERMQTWMPVPEANQPLLCTRVSRKIITQSDTALLYSSRYPLDGSIVCHLGEVHLGRSAQGHILNSLEFSE